MKASELKNVFTLIRSNIEAFEADRDNFIPFGWEELSEKALDIFDAELERVYIQAKK